MVELRQRVLQKNRSPPPDGQRNGDSAGAVPRRSSRRSGPELDDRQSEHRLKATYKNGIITIHGLAQRESNLDDGPATDNESQDNNNMTWEDRWLESPSKRRKVDRTASSQANSPVKESGKAPPSPTDPVPMKPSPNTPTAPSTGKSDDEQPKSRRGRFGRPELLLGRSRTSSSRYLNPAINAAKSLRGSSFGFSGDQSEAPEHARVAKESFDGVDNFSSARSTPIDAMSPAQSESPSPGPPEQDEEVPSGESAEAKEPNQLDDHDFPPPFLPFPSLPSSDQFPDEAAYLLSKLFPPMTQPNRFIRALTSHSPSERSTETLFALAQNTQKALKIWQDEYLRLDKRTAPVSIPIPKKPATGGRVPADPATFESEKQKELYGEGSVLAAAMGIVHGPVGGKTSNNSNSNNHVSAGSAGAHRGTGRELRKRKGDPSVLDGLGISSDDAGGRGVSKRTRRPARRFEIGQNAQEAPEPEPAPAKPVPGRRRRRGGAQGLSQRPAEKEQNGRVKRGRIGTLLRDESAPGSSAATPEVEDEKERAAGARKSTATDVAQSIEQKPARSQVSAARAGQAATARTSTAATTANNAAAPTVAGKVPIQANTTETTGPSGRRQKAKSEKRSESMTLWWAQRKKKAAEEKMRQMRERGELYGPTEGIMDTSEPINIGINKKRNAAAMNSQANATSAPSAAANKNFHARPMAMSAPHSYAPHQGQPLPPMHHQQQPPPPGSSFMWPNPPTPGGQQRNQHWPQPQPFHLPPGQHASQDSSPHSGRMQRFSHFPPPPPDHVVRGMGHPGHNYPPPSYPPSNPPGPPPMPPHPSQHQNPYPPPPYDHRSSHHPAHSPAHHHAPPPLLPPPTPSQQHPHHQAPDHGPNPPPLPGREGESRGHPPPPPLPPPRDDPGRPPSQGNQPSQSHYHHASHPGYGPIAGSPPGQGYNPPPPPPPPNQQHQQPKQQPHNYMHVHQLPLAGTPGPPPHHQHPPPPPPPPPPPGPGGPGGPGSPPMHGPPQSQQPGQSPKQDQQPNAPPQTQQPPMPHSRQQSHFYPMPWGTRFSRY